MTGENIYLTYYQVMIFMHRLSEIKNSNPDFIDIISKDFEDYVLRRAEEIALTYPQIKLKLIPNADKYCISQSIFNYLSVLTDINPLDKKIMKEYMPIIYEIEASSRAKLEEDYKKK